MMIEAKCYHCGHIIKAPPPKNSFRYIIRCEPLLNINNNEKSQVSKKTSSSFHRNYSFAVFMVLAQRKPRVESFFVSDALCGMAKDG